MKLTAPGNAARTAAAAGRVIGSFVLGLLALAVVRAATVVLGRRPGGLTLLGRYGGATAIRAGLAAAVLTAEQTRRRVPAYRAATAGRRPWRAAFVAGGLEGYLAALPVLDKVSYINMSTVDNRCRDGRLPERGVEVDESSGSSGRPYQWVRSRAELDQVERGLAVQAATLLRARRHRIVVLNCFSMGAWATGQSVTRALRRLGTVKSCGPDADRALAAVELLGPDACYVVCGYPPFLDALLDAAAARGLDLSGHELRGFVGGEAMSEVLRGRLERSFVRVLSAYGASDLDIGVAGETEFAVAVRRAAAADPDFAEALFGRTGRLPMIFQYDPSTYHVETVAGELIITVTRRLLSPRVRYTVHDVGAPLSYPDVLAAAKAHGVALPVREAARLPLLCVAGRADSTLSHMGANLYPEDVDTALTALADDRPELGLGTFCLELAEAGDGTTTPVVHVEVAPGPDPREDVRSALASWLVDHNRDWAAAAAEDPRALAFDIRTAAPGTGVFAASTGRIKRRYVLRTGGVSA